MHRSAGTVFLIVAMVVLIVIVDVLLLRDQFWLRLACNGGILALAGAIYFGFLRR